MTAVDERGEGKGRKRRGAPRRFVAPPRPSNNLRRTAWSDFGAEGRGEGAGVEARNAALGCEERARGGPAKRTQGGGSSAKRSGGEESEGKERGGEERSGSKPRARPSFLGQNGPSEAFGWAIVEGSFERAARRVVARAGRPAGVPRCAPRWKSGRCGMPRSGKCHFCGGQGEERARKSTSGGTLSSALLRTSLGSIDFRPIRRERARRRGGTNVAAPPIESLERRAGLFRGKLGGSGARSGDARILDDIAQRYRVAKRTEFYDSQRSTRPSRKSSVRASHRNGVDRSSRGRLFSLGGGERRYAVQRTSARSKRRAKQTSQTAAETATERKRLECVSRFERAAIESRDGPASVVPRRGSAAEGFRRAERGWPLFRAPAAALAERPVLEAAKARGLATSADKARHPLCFSTYMGKRFVFVAATSAATAANLSGEAAHSPAALPPGPRLAAEREKNPPLRCAAKCLGEKCADFLSASPRSLLPESKPCLGGGFASSLTGAPAGRLSSFCRRAAAEPVRPAPIDAPRRAEFGNREFARRALAPQSFCRFPKPPIAGNRRPAYRVVLLRRRER
ncbi:hypothetical protein KM043_001741 [Ampulex compressa]|nr:hypothetical protein KM043_001741 [Ampulex compressa]